MIPDSNDGLSSSSSSGRRKPSSQKTNLEFDFANGNGRPSIRENKPIKPSETIPLPRSETRMPTPTSIDSDTPSERTVRSSTTPQPSPTMSNPSFSQFQQNVQRQSREQKAVGSLLSGVAITLILGILLVAGLAGYGGYILSQQIKQQSSTISQLESRMNANFELLQTSLRETAGAMDTLNSQTQAQKQTIQSLQSQLETIRTQVGRDRAAADARLKKIDVRLLDIERELPTR